MNFKKKIYGEFSEEEFRRHSVMPDGYWGDKREALLGFGKWKFTEA